MNSREADGGDKIAAFERGLSDEDAHLAFETSDVAAYIVGEQFLVAFKIDREAMVVFIKLRLYGGEHSGWSAVDDFLETEARSFGCTLIVDQAIH